jgi:hypothetical protein
MIDLRTKLLKRGKSEMARGKPRKRGCLTGRNITVLVNRSKVVI